MRFLPLILCLFAFAAEHDAPKHTPEEIAGLLSHFTPEREAEFDALSREERKKRGPVPIHETRKAIRNLKHLSADEALPLILTAIYSTDYQIRENAVEALGDFANDPRAFALVEYFLTGKQAFAAKAGATFEVSKLRPDMAKSKDYLSTARASGAAKALKYFYDHEQYEPLVEQHLKKNPDLDTSVDLVLAIQLKNDKIDRRKLGIKWATKLATGKLRGNALLALTDYEGDDIEKILASAVKSKDKMERLGAAKVLYGRPSPSALKSALALIQKSSPFAGHRMHYYRTLNTFPVADPLVEAAYIDGLRDADIVVRTFVVAQLALRSREDKAADALLRRVAKKEFPARLGKEHLKRVGYGSDLTQWWNGDLELKRNVMSDVLYLKYSEEAQPIVRFMEAAREKYDHYFDIHELASIALQYKDGGHHWCFNQVIQLTDPPFSFLLGGPR